MHRDEMATPIHKSSILELQLQIAVWSVLATDITKNIKYHSATLSGLILNHSQLHKSQINVILVDLFFAIQNLVRSFEFPVFQFVLIHFCISHQLFTLHHNFFHFLFIA